MYRPEIFLDTYTKLISTEELLAHKGKIKRFRYMIRYSNAWHDVCSVNKTNKTTRLYYEYGVYEVELSKIESIREYLEG